MGGKLIIGHQSALTVYRLAGQGITAEPEAYDAYLGAHECITRVGDFLESGLVDRLLRHGGIDLVARAKSGRHKAKESTIHLLSGELPHGSFRKVSGDILVTSPAITLYMLGREALACAPLDRPDWCAGLTDEFGELGLTVALAEIASELCGIYSLPPFGGKGLIRHRSFATLTAMKAQIGSLKHKRHANLAFKALQAASNLSASPRETQLYLMMTAPWPIGYGMPKPATNQPVLLGDQSLESGEDCATIRFSDYFWNEKKLRNGRVRRPCVLEYDSNEFHTASAGITDRQLADQAERRDDIEASGNGFLRITTEHTRSFEQFNRKMNQLANLLRIDLPERSANELELAERFFSLIFDSKRLGFTARSL